MIQCNNGMELVLKKNYCKETIIRYIPIQRLMDECFYLYTNWIYNWQHTKRTSYAYPNLNFCLLQMKTMFAI